MDSKTYLDPPKPRALFVDDEADITEIAEHYFQLSGWEIEVAHNIDCAKDRLQSRRFDVVLSDIVMRGGSGDDLLQWMKAAHGRPTPFFLLTGCIDTHMGEAKDRGVEDVFFKPCHWPAVIKRLSESVMANR